MKFLTDENIAINVFKFLKQSGFDIKNIKEVGLEGKSDYEVLKFAYNENRIIITHDKDFGYLFYTKIEHKGIILLRFKNQKPDNVFKCLIKILQSDVKNKLENNIVIISENKIIIHKM